MDTDKTRLIVSFVPVVTSATKTLIAFIRLYPSLSVSIRVPKV